MATMQGYTDGSYDYSHMYNVKDLNGKLPVPQIHKDSVIGYLTQENISIPFIHMLKKCNLAGIYNDPNASMTVFIPVQLTDCFVMSIDQLTCRKIVNYHTLERPLCYDFLTSSKGMLLNTKQTGSTIFLEKDVNGQVFLNRESKLLGTKRWGNSMLCFIDRPISIDNNPLTNISI